MSDSTKCSEHKFSDFSIDELRNHLCEAHEASQAAEDNALSHALTAGHCLNEMQIRDFGPGSWKRWLETQCPWLPVPTAKLYQQLARHVEEIEAARRDNPHLSLRAARQLITKPKTRNSDPKKKLDITAVIAWWRAAPLDERTALLDGISLDEFYAALPKSWRERIATRVAGHVALKEQMDAEAKAARPTRH